MKIPTRHSSRLAAADCTRASTPEEPDTALTLRFATPDDGAALARLAALDSATPPAQPVLLAEVGGQLHAALSLSEATVVADPFRSTAELIELLRARARQLYPKQRSAGLNYWLRRSFSPAFT